MASSTTQSYIDIPALTSPTFTPHAYANTLLLSTNIPTDTPLDLSTPLSRLLFDQQEIDTHLDALTTGHAVPIIEHTQRHADSSQRILAEVETQVQGLQESYARLEREVVQRYEHAEEVRVAAERMLRTLRLGRQVQRAVVLGRQLEAQMEGVVVTGERRGMVLAAGSLLGLRGLFEGGRGEGLERVQVLTTLRNEIVAPAERSLLAKAQQGVREFSMSSLLSSSSPSSGTAQAGPGSQQTYAQTEDTKARATSALQTLYLLSPIKATTSTTTASDSFTPTLLIAALSTYLQTALTSSLAALSRALATLPQLDRTLLEISARCQNIVALETLLASTPPPPHPLLADPTSSPPAASTPPTTTTKHNNNLLSLLLRHLDTSSLPSYFWRSLAGQLTSRVADIMARGGVSARTLRTNRERVREMIRECVDRGTRLPGEGPGGKREGGWEREAAVMVGAVMGPLGR
ncbi:Conserved oligomeric Golgi complex subunit [Teratosphaeriaceae sp. CCFEE 6253]|nr:Conserved oligomeric Golgi complex subunit [Teratosphaeriaceae sp. CCFEE 6253]